MFVNLWLPGKFSIFHWFSCLLVIESILISLIFRKVPEVSASAWSSRWGLFITKKNNYLARKITLSLRSKVKPEAICASCPGHNLIWSTIILPCKKFLQSHFGKSLRLANQILRRQSTGLSITTVGCGESCTWSFLYNRVLLIILL